METELRRHLTKCAIVYGAHYDYSLSRVGHLSLRDGTFFDRIQTKSFTARTYDRVMTWFDRNWPESLGWPSNVPRPSAKSEAA